MPLRGIRLPSLPELFDEESMVLVGQVLVRQEPLGLSKGSKEHEPQENYLGEQLLDCQPGTYN